MKDEILAAYDRIAPLVRQTPLEYSAELGAFLKLEHLQHTGSFKFRGASNKIAHADARSRPRRAWSRRATAITAWAWRRHRRRAALRRRYSCLPTSLPAKARRIEAMGARIHCAGDDPLTAELAARRAAEHRAASSSRLTTMWM